MNYPFPMDAIQNQTDPSTLDSRPFKELIQTIARVLSGNDGVLFAYLYGSSASGEKGRDVDIGIFSEESGDPHRLSSDLKVALSTETGLSPDVFDIRILNGLNEQGDLFALLYLKNVLSSGRILVDRDPDLRSDFLERYGSKFRECEGLIQEVLA